MLGAIIGDIVGSRFEFANHKSKDFDLFAPKTKITDDSIMTLALAKAIMSSNETWDDLGENAVKFMRELGRLYPKRGYGSGFRIWLFCDVPKPYNSYGNGAAMRVSPAAFVARSLDETLLLSQKITEVTHDHPEGIKGAQATAAAIFLAKSGVKIEGIREHVEKHYYKLDFTLDGIRDTYKFNETCQGTVPQAIVAFLESVSFEDALRNAISIGGDSDTIGAITGGIAEAYYGVPDYLRKRALAYLDNRLLGIFTAFEDRYMNAKPC